MKTSTFTIEQNPDFLKISCKEQFTMAEMSELRDALLSHDPKPMIFSLVEAKAIDVAAIQLLFCCKNEAVRKGYPFSVVFPAEPSIQDLLQKTGITKLF